MTVAIGDRIATENDPRLHKPGVQGSSPCAASNDSVSICHTPAHIYHQWQEISCSNLKELARSPVAFYERVIAKISPHAHSASMEYGTLLHLWGELGEEKFWDVCKTYPSEVLTASGAIGKDAKAWLASQPEGTVICTPDDMEKLRAQTRQILANPAAANLLSATIDNEFNVKFQWSGHACRCRCDGATEKVWWDLKTTREANPLKTAYRAVAEFNYDLQAAFYGEAARQCGWPQDMRLHFIFTSTTWPYLSAVVVLPPDVMERGRLRCLQLMHELRERRDWNQWLPNDYGEVHELECPAWMRGGA